MSSAPEDHGPRNGNPAGNPAQPQPRSPEPGTETTLSVIVPIYNSAATIEACLRALTTATGPTGEIIVVDDGSTDGGLRGLPDDLIGCITEVTSAVNIGRGPARNLGADKACGDVLVFVDSDVAVHPDALSKLRSAFANDPGLMAAIGSYDDRPAAPGLVSQYRNLLHHHTHHTRGPTATHFWTGLGAVRRHLFETLGGLDDTTWARNMEDVEFGHRIVDGGHTIAVMPDVEGTHHKALTVASMARIDLCDRAIPWSTLMLRQGLRTDPFVVSPGRAVAAGATALTALGLVAAPFSRKGRILLGAALAGFVAVNANLFGFFARVRGAGFAVATIPLHLLHTAASAAGFVTAAAREALRAAVARPTGQTPHERTPE